MPIQAEREHRRPFHSALGRCGDDANDGEDHPARLVRRRARHYVDRRRHRREGRRAANAGTSTVG